MIESANSVESWITTRHTKRWPGSSNIQPSQVTGIAVIRAA
jgi:hypothetical protein